MAASITSQLCVILALCFTLSCAQGPRVVCYFNNKAQHWPGVAKFDVSNIDPTICTHLVYGYAHVQGTQIVPTEANDDTPTGFWKQAVGLKSANPSLKVLLSIGGPDQNRDELVNLVNTTSLWPQFIQDGITTLRYWKFDGVVFDWDDPLRDEFAGLVEEMYTKFEEEATNTNRDRLMLVVTVPGKEADLNAFFDAPRLNVSSDFFNVKSIDYATGWENVTALATPTPTTPGVVNSIRLYTDTLGIPPSKLNMGLAMYATTFTLARSNDTEPGSPASGPGTPGNYTMMEGRLSYYEVCEGYISKGGAGTFHPAGWVMYTSDSETSQWVTYENSRSLTTFKSREVTMRGLGGITVWSLEYDDFNGQFCGAGTYTLLRGIYNKLYGITTPAPTTTTTPTTLETTTEEMNTTEAMNMTDMDTTTAFGTERSCPFSYLVYPDPYSCNHFRTCVFDQTFRSPCDPETFIYNDDIKACEDPVNSTYVCTTIPTPTTPGYPCPTSDATGNYPNRDSCQDYFFCYAGSAFGATCPSGQIFNPDTAVCEDSSTTTYTPCATGGVA